MNFAFKNDGFCIENDGFHRTVDELGDVPAPANILRIANIRPFFNRTSSFSGEILHSFCIFNGKDPKRLAITLQFATNDPSIDRCFGSIL